MKRTERTRIDRLYELIDKVPFPASGTKTQSFIGNVAYVEDMREFLHTIKQTLYGIMVLDAIEYYRRTDFDESEYTHPDTLLDALEMWIHQREREEWRESRCTIRQCLVSNKQ
jgi:hypothetical protein